MISKEHILSTREISSFSHRCLLDDRQDYAIEVLGNIAGSEENCMEDRILALYNLGDIYWNYIGDLDRAFEYICSALELSENTDENFCCVVRGKLLKSKLNLLIQLGKNEEAEMEFERIINKYSSKNAANNSLLFYAYQHRGELEYEKGSYKAALEYLEKAAMCCPVKFYAYRLHVVEVEDYKKEFDNLKLLLSRNVYSPDNWEI